MNRRPIVGAAILFAVVLTGASLVPRGERSLLVGRPGDATVVDGFSLPSEYLGERGRWTRGDGTLRLPAYGAPAAVSLRLATVTERIPDPVDIEINGAQLHHVTLGSGVTAIDVPIARPRLGEPIVVRIRSASDRPGGGAPQGVFVGRVTLRTGGLERLVRTGFAVWVQLLAIWLAVIVLAARLTAAPAKGLAGWLLTASLVTLAYVAFVGFRADIFPHLAAVAALCWAAAIAVMTAASGAMTRKLDRVSTRRAAGAFLVGALALFCLLFPRAITHGLVLSQADMLFDYMPWQGHVPEGYQRIERSPLNDVPMLSHPFAAFTQSRWRERIFPMWTSSMASGQPFLGTYQSALFSPFTAVLLAVPLPRATVVIAMLRLLVGGLGMFVFLRTIGLSHWAAAWGGVTYLFNPFSLVWLEHPLSGVPPWLPWMLVGAEMIAAGRAFGVAVLASTTGLVFTGGHPHLGLFIATLGGGYAILRAAISPHRVRTLAEVCAALAIGTALATVQMWPFLEYLSLSRAATVRNAAALNPYVTPASTLITALVPNFLGHHGSGNFAGPSNYFEQQIYPGIATWLLAAVAMLFAARRWRTWFFAFAALVPMLVMYGAPYVHQLVSALPLIRAASLPRIAIIAIAALSVLAAFGVEEVLREDRTRRTAWLLTAAVVLIAGGLTWVTLGTLHERMAFLESRGLMEFTTRWTAVALWLICAVSLVGIIAAHGRGPRAAAGCALVGLAALDLLLFGRGYHPLIPPQQVFPVVPEVQFVQQDPGLFRVLGLREALTPNAAMVYGLQDIRGYDGLGVARYDELLDVALRDQGFLHRADAIHSPLINLLNVKYVFGTPEVRPPDGWFTQVTPGEGGVYVNNRVFPRAFLVDGYVVRDGNPARRTLRDGLVDFRRVVLLEQEPDAAERPAAAASDGDVGEARVSQYRDQRVVIRTGAPGPRLLVLTDVYYPGWRVSIDGKAARLYRANFAFRAVAVPAGEHTVTFEYRPASVLAGAAVSGVALLILTGAVARDYRRGRRTAPAVER
jgi:hypothetical protein